MATTHFENCGLGSPCNAILVGEPEDAAATTLIKGYRTGLTGASPILGCGFEGFPGQMKGATIAGVLQDEAFQEGAGDGVRDE